MDSDHQWIYTDISSPFDVVHFPGSTNSSFTTESSICHFAWYTCRGNASSFWSQLIPELILGKSYCLLGNYGLSLTQELNFKRSYWLPFSGYVIHSWAWFYYQKLASCESLKSWLTLIMTTRATIPHHFGYTNLKSAASSGHNQHKKIVRWKVRVHQWLGGWAGCRHQITAKSCFPTQFAHH